MTRMRCAGWLLAGVVALVGAGSMGWAATPGKAPVAGAVRLATPAKMALSTAIPELNVDNVPLVKVLDYLRDFTGANVVVNWKALEEKNVQKETPITLNINEISMRKALRLVLDQASPTAILVFPVDSNVISITTQDEADKVMITKVYVVDDLVMTNPQITTPPTMNLSAMTTSGTTTGGGSGGGMSGTSGGSLFGSSSGSGGGSAQPEETTQKRGEDLVKLITEVVRPNIWRDNGGTASIRYFSGKLIITAPVSVHEAIGGPVAPEGGQRIGM